jgi:hypothetical protein
MNKEFIPQIFSKAKKEWRSFSPNDTKEEAEERIKKFQEWDTWSGYTNTYRILENTK